MRRALLSSSLLFSLALSLAGARADAPASPPQINVYSCQVVVGAGLPHKYDIGLAVRFENESAATYSSIVWRARYRNVPVDFIDDGTFSPATRIDNYLLFETGSSKILWFNVLAGLYMAANGIYDAAPMSKDSLELRPFVGTPYPQNCTIVRAIDSAGHLWLNPAVAQNAARALPVPTPIPAFFRKPAALAVPADPQRTSGPVEIEHCTLSFDAKRYLEIRYRNIGRPADSITFRARYADSGLDFTDVGAFSPGVDIAHTLRADVPQELQHMMYLSGDDPNLCDVVNVHYADGSSWINDSIPAQAPALPAPPPDAIDLMKARAQWTQRHAYPTPLPSVISGALWVGMGKTMDKSKMTELGPGAFVTVPPNFAHYAMAKTDTVIQIEGMGPETMVEAK